MDGTGSGRSYMIRKLAALFGAFLVAAAANPSATAGQSVPCDDHDKVVAALDSKYAEKPASIGLSNDGSVIEVFVSDDGTFTIVMTLPIGVSCFMAAGDNWEQIPLLAGDQGV